ncbi:MAG: helix-turn-helix transcriptional regulator, partial [Candidatus Marinimicrobia bacterium]|nr:helix-turn-helix transcriptional regulator [Bacteroidota bacterium]MBL7010904.1 helix-turn-helix transcriptional regulator [Candidatus Neomarinimicrobiota bacterium]
MNEYTERQDQIIQESIQLIAEKGIQGLTIKNISKAIGITEPAIYRHFDSKNDIILG